MDSAIAIAIVLLSLYSYVLIARLIIEMIQSYSRRWQPQRWFAMIAEPIFVLTDPPLKLVRRIIPPARMGGVSVDFSPLLIFFAIQLLVVLLSNLV